MDLDGEAWDIFWGAYLGTADQILIQGRLGQVRDEIRRVRHEARVRHGWIMDTYLLRRRAAARDGQDDGGALESRD